MYKANQDACQVEFDMHKSGKPKPQEWNKPADAMDYILNISQGSGKIQKEAPKGAKKPTVGQTKIEVWNDTCVAYKQQITQDSTKSMYIIATVF